MCSYSSPTLCDPWIVAHQAPPSMGFSRQEYRSGLPFPSPGDLPDSGIGPRSPTVQADALTSAPPGKPLSLSLSLWKRWVRLHAVLFESFITGKGKWKEGVVGVSILQNRPDPRGGLRREGSEGWVSGLQGRLVKRERRRRACGPHFTSAPPSGQSLRKRLQAGALSSRVMFITLLSELCTEPKAMAPHSRTLAWKIPWTKEPGRLSMGSLRVGHDWATLFHFHALEKEMATHSSVLAWRIPGTGEPGGLPSMGSHRVGHDGGDLAAGAAASM